MSGRAGVQDNWEHGDAYELFIGRWSSLVAVEFLDWLDLPSGLRWIDVGCGTGALSEAILDTRDPASVDGVEPSAGFLRAAHERLGDRATLHQAPAEELPLPQGSADIVVSGLVLNFIPDLPAALAEMKRVAPGGIVSAYVWDYGGGMDMLRLFWEAADEVDPGGSADEGRRFPLCRPDALVSAFLDAGLEDPEVVALDIETPFADFDALWMPFTGGQGAGPSYLMSLDETTRAELRERLRDRVPTNPDGSISLIARAWAIRSTVPV
ncbi:MAG TPA: methyltransferase domain-containing protein [Galbitalea sp.]